MKQLDIQYEPSPTTAAWSARTLAKSGSSSVLYIPTEVIRILGLTPRDFVVLETDVPEMPRMRTMVRRQGWCCVLLLPGLVGERDIHVRISRVKMEAEE